MNLFPHQQEVLELNPDRYLLAHGTGTGKSLMALELAKKRHKAVLIICPKMLKEKWLRDIRGLQAIVLTKEEFKRREKDLGNYPIVIVDEAHAFYGIKSQLHKSLVRYFKRYDTPYRYFLTATPYLSTPWNIYAAAILMGESIDYRKFQYTFFHEVRMGHRFVWQAKEDAHSKDLLRQLVRRLGTAIQLEDVFEVPYQTHQVVRLDLTDPQAERIAAAYDPVAIVQWTMQHRIENEEGAKLDWLRSFAKMNKKFVLFARYRSQMDELRVVLSLMGYSVLVIHGEVSDRDAVIARANALSKVILIIQASCSEGYELPTFDTVVYASLSFSYKDLVQSQGRVLRANALHSNNYYYLIIQGGVDEEVWKALQNKVDFSFELLARTLSTPARNKQLR